MNFAVMFQIAIIVNLKINVQFIISIIENMEETKNESKIIN